MHIFCLSLHRLAIIPTVLLLAALLLPSSAFAHERRTIAGGAYDVVVGWDVEPAIEGEKNAASIRVTRAGTQDPIEGVQDTLRVQIRQGGQAREFPLRAVFRQPGYYVADLVPTRAGDYQWTFVGSIGGVPVQEVFDTADKQFNAVEPIEPLQFPLRVGGPAEILQAEAAAQTAQTMAMVGIGVGVLGLAAAGAAWTARPRHTGTSGGARPVAERA